MALTVWKDLNKILFATKHFEEKQRILEPVILFAEMFNAKLSVTKFTDEDTAEAADDVENTELLFAYMENVVLDATSYKNEIRKNFIKKAGENEAIIFIEVIADINGEMQAPGYNSTSQIV